jgi:hypothetical protein
MSPLDFFQESSVPGPLSILFAIFQMFLTISQPQDAPPVSTIPMVNLLLVSRMPAVHFDMQIFFQIFKNNLNKANETIEARGR